MIDDILSIIEQGELWANLKIFEIALDQLLVDVLVVSVDDLSCDCVLVQEFVLVEMPQELDHTIELGMLFSLQYLLRCRFANFEVESD